MSSEGDANSHGYWVSATRPGIVEPVAGMATPERSGVEVVSPVSVSSSHVRPGYLDGRSSVSHPRDVETMDDLADVTAPERVEPSDLVADADELWRVRSRAPALLRELASQRSATTRRAATPPTMSARGVVSKTAHAFRRLPRSWTTLQPRSNQGQAPARSLAPAMQPRASPGRLSVRATGRRFMSLAP